MAPKNKGGRPPIINAEKLRLLKEAFLRDCTDEEACQYAEIASSTFYDYQKAHPEFSEQKKLWKTNVKLKARFNIADGIEKGDKELSKWYAERKFGDEFIARQKQDINGNFTGINPITINVIPIKSENEL